MGRRLQIGDEVKILEANAPVPIKYEGEIGKIVKVHHDSGPYLVYFSDGAQWWFRESRLKLIEDRQTTTKRELKVGDKVRMMGRAQRWLQSRGYTIRLDGEYTKTTVHKLKF